MTDDWASKIRESMDRAKEAADRNSPAMRLYNNQTQAGMMNYRSGGTTQYTATTTGDIINPSAIQAVPPPNRSRYRYTPQNAPASPTPFSGAPLESASLYGTGQVNEFATGEGQEDQGGGGGDNEPMPQRQPRERRPSTPMKKHLMGSAGGGGLDQLQRNRSTANQFQQLQRSPSQFQQLQRSSYAAAPTPRQRFTA